MTIGVSWSEPPEKPKVLVFPAAMSADDLARLKREWESIGHGGIMLSSPPCDDFGGYLVPRELHGYLRDVFDPPPTWRDVPAVVYGTLAAYIVLPLLAMLV